MKNRKYLYRLSKVMLLGLFFPALLFFMIFWRYAFDQIEQGNEDFYENALLTYTSLLDKKIQDLERFAAEISAESRRYDSTLFEGAENLTEDPYQLYVTVNELSKKYTRSDVVEWGIYFYDTDKIITPQYAYTLDHFLYKYTGKNRTEAECGELFSEEKYSIRNTLFHTTGEEEIYNRYLLAGVCTRIGKSNDRAMIFYVLSPKNISDSLAIVGGEGIAYYLLDKDSDDVLLAWGEIPEKSAGEVLASDAWKRISGIKQKVLYNIKSNYRQLSVTAYISQNSMQSDLIDWAVTIRILLLCTVIFLLLICAVALYVSYKPVHELIREIDDSDGGEFERIRNTLNGKDSKIGEQEMLILDLLVNHLIYGVPIAEERIKRLGIEESARYYCVFLTGGYFFTNSEAEKLSAHVKERHNARIFITDWQEENYSVVIAFLHEEDISGLREELARWLQENYAPGYTLYTGRTVDKLENIQLSFRSCLSQMKKKNDKKQKSDGDIPTSREEQQKKTKEEVLAYLELHYRESDLSQVQVADRFRISNYTLSRLFKNQVGVGFAEYLTAKRLECAKELLLTTSYSVKEVAAMAGFASENYFSRTFKLYEGVSPSAFRKK